MVFAVLPWLDGARIILRNTNQTKTMTTDLFQIEPTKPTKLQAARRALADAERELEAALERTGGDDCPDYERDVNRFAELVKAEELAAMNISKEKSCQ